MMGEATRGTNREGHEGLLGRGIVGGMRTKAQDQTITSTTLCGAAPSDSGA